LHELPPNVYFSALRCSYIYDPPEEAQELKLKNSRVYASILES
jgi:hypothetical protein